MTADGTGEKQCHFQPVFSMVYPELSQQKHYTRLHDISCIYQFLIEKNTLVKEIVAFSPLK